MWQLDRRLLLFVPLALLLWRSWGPLQRNQALLTLNQLPTLWATIEGADQERLAAAESQLLASLAGQRADVATQRLLAVVQRAQGRQPAAGVSAGELLWWGRQQELAGDREAAYYLYRWATEAEPALADGWYYLGKLYHEDEAWAAAEEQYRQALAAGRSASEASVEAAAHYRLAELLLWQGDDPAAAVPHYQAALSLTPADHWARLRLGYALYWSTGDIGAAEREILAAIEQWPDEKYLKWPYFYLAELYQDAGRFREAAAAYEQVLALDPADERVRERLALLGGE
jgi:tetratricopeptide (TPR) repeat protein